MYDLLQKPANYAENYRYNYTCQDHCCYGEIKAEIFFFNSNVARQVTDPVKLVVKEIDDQPNYHYRAANEHQILAGI